MENIKENNKLIAEFLGYPLDEKENLHWVDTEESYGYKTSDLKYHSDWNWLMECIKEIKDVDSKFKLKHLGAFVSWEHRFKESLFIGIDNTYSTVVEFIKWYNETK